MSNHYKEHASKYVEKGLTPLAIKPAEKRPAASGWQKLHDNEKWLGQHQKWIQSSADYGVGLLLGSSVRPDYVFAALDIDREEYIEPVDAVLGDGRRIRKKGMKGTTFIVQADERIKTERFNIKGLKGNTVELLSKGACTVLPPSIHPKTKQPYRWETEPLDVVDLNSLPVVDVKTFEKIRFIAKSKHLRVLFDGKDTHVPGLKFINSAVRLLSDKEIKTIIKLALPNDYKGNFLEEMPGMIESAREKGFDKIGSYEYDPGTTGPVPLGYTDEEKFVLLDQQRNIIIYASMGQLMTGHYLMGLESTRFWAKQFPGDKKFSAYAAAETLRELCLACGPFVRDRVRGRGVWLEGDTVVVNLGAQIKTNGRYTYICFDPLPFVPEEQPNLKAEKVLEYLQLFNWRHTADAYLLLGWLTIAPICGALPWRPHCFLHGPKNTGKTTLMQTITHLLGPLCISIDGGSTEAGIRQKLKNDSLPVIIDEFESDQERKRLANIIKLARSASSAESSVLKGTSEGKAMQFSIRTSFMFAAINPLALSAADESRIVQLELKKHDNDPETRRRVVNGAKRLQDVGAAWCGNAISYAAKLPKSVEMLESAFPSCDSRHRTNMATLLAGAYLALNGKIPSREQAEEWMERFENAIMRHEEAHLYDDAQECLTRLFSFLIHEHGTLGKLLAEALEAKRGRRNCDQAVKTLLNYGIRVEENGFYIPNGQIEIDKAFTGTRWESGWRKSLRKIDGVKAVDPIQIPGIGKPRATFVPAELIPEKVEGMELGLRI